MAFAEGGFQVLGMEVSAAKVKALLSGESYIGYIGSEPIRRMVEQGRLDATLDFDRASELDVVIICVPTPLNEKNEPDLSYIVRAGEVLSPHVRQGQLYVLESTSYPGTTEEVLQPLLERKGLGAGKDFHLAFSPEREDPGNKQFHTRNIPKVISGLSPRCLEVTRALYSCVISQVVAVSSTRTAELAKLIENIFRCVNIAMVNEIKVVCERMGIDVWEAIDAAATKPFGYMPFYPGPGLGGHCIPIDPFYLSWKARQYGTISRLIELAGEINRQMPGYVIERTAQALQAEGKRLEGAKVLLLGVAYKRDVDDVRESPALRILELLSAQGVQVDYHDPHVPRLVLEELPERAPMNSVPLTPDSLAGYDAVLVLADHSAVDYRAVVENASIVIDTRNATRGLKALGAKIYGA
jgi:UDP-N-acetyl-D-glucosamine dehydrogenase